MTESLQTITKHRALNTKRNNFIIDFYALTCGVYCRCPYALAVLIMALAIGNTSLALLDRFFFFSIFGWRKKGSGERPISFLFYNPQFLGVVNWLLMAFDQRQRAVK